MTTPTPELRALEVTQADRDAAAGFAIAPENDRKIRAGEMDWHPAVKAFARHRLDHTAALEAELAGVRKALEPFAKAADVKLCGEWKDTERFGQSDVNFYLTFGDLRRARKALAP